MLPSDPRLADDTAPTVADTSFRLLNLLREGLGNRFVQGIVLYTGQDALAFGDRLTALPMDAPWRA